MGEEEEKESKAKKTTATTKGTRRYIVPIVDNFRRSKKGRRLVEQECNKLLDLQVKTFPNKSMLDVDGKVISYDYNGRQGTISKAEFLLKAPYFLESYFVNTRRKVDFGAKVHGMLTGIEQEITKKYKSKPLHEFVWMVAAAKITATKGYVEEEAEEDVEMQHEEEDDDAEDGSESD